MISLKEFLSYEFANDVKPVYSLIAPEQITIRSISILEPPVEQFVRKDEIVISTALSVRDDYDLLFHFINDIYESDAAALILAFPNDSFKQLDQLKDHFHKLNFPILTIPWSHLFSDLVENTLKEIWAGDKKTQNHLEFLQKDLLQNYLSGKTLSDAAEIIYEYIGCNILIVDINEKIKGNNIRFSEKNSEDHEAAFADDQYRMQVKSGDKLYGYVIFETNAVLYNTEPQILEQCIITPLTLWFDKEWSLTASKMKSKKDFVWKIAHDGYSSPQEIASKAELLGFNYDCSYICFVGFMIAKSDVENGNWNINHDTSFLMQSVSNIVQEQILIAAQVLDLSVMTTVHNKTVIVYLEKPAQDMGLDTANDYLNSLDSYLNRSLSNITLIWGFDNQAMPMENLSISYRNAKTALNISLQSGSHSLRNCYQLSIRQKILYTLCNDSETVMLANETLRNMIEYDESKGSELLNTLSCFCETNFNVSETARLMHLHRQSLLYRLSKIEALSNLSLKDHNDLFVLEICIMILKGKS